MPLTSSSSRGSGRPSAFQPRPASTGSVTGWISDWRRMVSSIAPSGGRVAPAARAAARASAISASTVCALSSTSACRLTMAMCSCSPASPNIAAANGRPTCTVLPKLAVTALTADAAGPSCKARTSSRSRRATPSRTSRLQSSSGAKKASSSVHGRCARSTFAIERNSSAGTKTRKARLDSARRPTAPPVSPARAAPKPMPPTMNSASSRRKRSSVMPRA